MKVEFKDSKLGPLDTATDSTWDVAGRSIDGKLKGWTLEPVDAVVCKWFAWSAEYPETEVYGQNDALTPKRTMRSRRSPARRVPAITAEAIRGH